VSLYFLRFSPIWLKVTLGLGALMAIYHQSQFIPEVVPLIIHLRLVLAFLLRQTTPSNGSFLRKS
jgi:hypothetical protein